MDRESRDRIERHWATRLGCNVEALRAACTTVVPSPAGDAHSSVFFFRYGEACVVSAARPAVDEMAPALDGVAPPAAFDRGVIDRLFGDAVEAIVGPAYQGYVDPASFHMPGAGAAVMLGPSDDAALRDLAASCTALEWEHSAIEFGRPPIFGVYEGDELVAASTLRGLDQRFPDVGVVTSPAHRGRGHGRMAVAAATAYGLEHAGFVAYQTLESNAPAIAIARALGYRRYARTMSVRLR